MQCLHAPVTCYRCPSCTPSYTCPICHSKCCLALIWLRCIQQLSGLHAPCCPLITITVPKPSWSAPMHTSLFAGMALDLRSPLGVTPAALPATIKKSQEAQLARLYAKDTAAMEARKTRKLYEGFISSRKTLLQSQSQRRLRSPCVDFERIWWDRDLRGFSKSGISIWRPAPPPGYVSLGESSMLTESVL